MKILIQMLSLIMMIVFLAGCETRNPNVKASVAGSPEEAKGGDHNVGDDVTIGVPFDLKKVKHDIELIVMETQLSDAYGNKAIGSFVYGKANGSFFFRGYALYREGSSNRLVISAPVSIDQILRSKNNIGQPLNSKALLHPGPGGKLEFVMECTNDAIALVSFSTTPIGLGSEMRFDQENWVDFLGANYRKGGFKVTQEGIQFDAATEKNEGGKIFKYQGGQWMPAEAN
jgi:hypothetical protein